MADKQAIGVVGVGWVGLVTASCFAEMGHPVVAMDIDGAKVEALRKGEVPFHEPDLPELVAKNAERLRFTTDKDEPLGTAKLLFCCVDTPPTVSGDADLSRVQAVLETLPEGSDHVLVMKSTVPAGTGAAIRREKPALAYVSCPEFLKEGSAVSDFMNPDRVVIGADPGDEAAADAVEEVYRPLGGEVVRTDVASAEMIKLAANAAWASTSASARASCTRASATGARVSRRTSQPSSSSPATPATTSNC
jgi:UDPglucose 6-dehydrogenase